MADVNAKEYPYVFVVKLILKKRRKTYHGTGVILDEHNILTNAHNVVGKDRIVIYPGYSREDRDPFGKIEVPCERDSTIFYPDEYLVKRTKQSHDFAIIKYDDPGVYNKLIQSSNGRNFSLDLVNDVTSKKLHISGYPVYRWFEVWKPKGGKVQVANDTERHRITREVLLNYRLNTRGGSSGSPLWVENNDNLIICGIHKSGSGFRNQGIWYDQSRLDMIRSWMER